MLLASCALVCVADNRPQTCLVSRPACRLVFPSVFRQICLPVFHPACRLVFRLIFRQICWSVFHPVCHSAGQRTSLSAATVSPAGKRAQKVDVVFGCRRHRETKAEAGGWQDSWCAARRSVPRVVPLAVLVQILGRIVLVPILVWIRVPIVPIPRAWGGKTQGDVPKGGPLVEQCLQDGRTPGRLVSAVPVDRPVGRLAGQPVDWGEAFLKSGTVAWVPIEPRAPAAHPLVSPAARQSVLLHCAPGHRFSAGHEAFFLRLARSLGVNCEAKDRKTVRVFPPAVVSSTPC